MKSLALGRHWATLLALAVGVNACTDSATAPSTVPTVVNARGVNSSNSGAECATPSVVPLVADLKEDHHANVGSVAVLNRGSNLDVTFTTTNGWTLKSTAVVVASRAEDIAKRVEKGKGKKKANE